MVLCLNSKWRDTLIKLFFKKYLPVTLIKRYKYYQNNYNSKIEELVNVQIWAEQQAAQDYLNMAVTFLHPAKSQLGAGGFFMKMYEEELCHMKKLINYQLLRGGMPLICGLQPPNKNKDLTLLDAFKKGLHMEKNITVGLQEGVMLAEDLKDYHYADFITSVFLTEQMHSIHEMANHITKLSALSHDNHAIYHYDLELEKMYPLPHKLKSEMK
ncbi:hypothetical protein PYW08_015404 [Mythimna loreyi]|uniref:Uncharacterized protein n=1 Tax=Mythimna loreyi TaxID=667449 RepID=A0ACC2QWP3_9NEOP|nr:hypothetical protein PYW08_015404 [Mythimna loreyi]